MSRKTIEIIESDIVKRLSEIAFHFEERDSLCESLSSFTQDDAIEHGPKKVEFDRVVQRINNEELDILLKLVHLKDTVVKYFNAWTKTLSKSMSLINSGPSELHQTISILPSMGFVEEILSQPSTITVP